MKRALLFLAAGIAAVSIAVACPLSAKCKMHLAEAEYTRTEAPPDGRCLCVYQHEVNDNTGSWVHTFKIRC